LRSQRHNGSRESPADSEGSFFDPEAIMAGRTEQPPAAVRVVELAGVSKQSWSDAAQEAVARASRMIRHLTGLDVLHRSAVVEHGQVTEYRVQVRLSFVVEGREAETLRLHGGSSARLRAFAPHQVSGSQTERPALDRAADTPEVRKQRAVPEAK
jgi:flavin-binding protein dodecin